MISLEKIKEMMVVTQNCRQDNSCEVGLVGFLFNYEFKAKPSSSVISIMIAPVLYDSFLL